MKKWIVVFLSFCMLLGIAACGAEKTENIPMPENKSEEPAANVETTPVTEAGAEKPEDSSTNQSGSKILIAYFTWAENTQVENPEEVDVDATTSASVLLPGNTAKMAGWIQQKVGGDLFSIVVSEPYSSDYDECLDRAADEKAENARPELVNSLIGGIPGLWQFSPLSKNMISLVKRLYRFVRMEPEDWQAASRILLQHCRIPQRYWSRLAFIVRI